MEVQLQPLERNTQALQREVSSKVKRQETTEKSENAEKVENGESETMKPSDSISSPNPDTVDSKATSEASPASAASTPVVNNEVTSSINSKPNPSPVSNTNEPVPAAVDGNDAAGAGPPSKVAEKQPEQFWWPCVIGTIDRASKSVWQTRCYIFLVHILTSHICVRSMCSLHGQLTPDPTLCASSVLLSRENP